MILTTTETISGRELETLGLVRGSTIRSKNIGKDITQGFKTLVGGELKAYTEMMNEARALAPSGWWRRRSSWEPTRWCVCATHPPPSCRGRPRSSLTARR